MENKLKNFLFEAVEYGKIVKFTTSNLELECPGSKITVSWRKDTPQNTIVWHNLHIPIHSMCCCTADGYSYASDVKVVSINEPTIYQITFENGLRYDVPMTIVESDKLTALLSEAFQKYQEHYMLSIIDHWNIYSHLSAYDDLLEEPTHVN